MKKITAMLLVGIMGGSLVACGSSGSSGGAASTTAPATSSGETAATEASATTEAAASTTDVPELKGPGNVTLKRLGGNVGFDVNTDYMVPVIKQATGYDVEYSSLPAESADEKLLLDLSSGVSYDVVNVPVNTWRTLVAKNALQPMDDPLDAYGQDILKGNTDEVWNTLKGSDGHIYGVPYMYPADKEVASFMACRWDLMQEAGITEIPTTIDDFYNDLVALKKRFGDKYIILSGPFRPASEGNENWVIPKTIASAFGIYSDWMLDENGKVIYMTEAPGFKDMVGFLSKCQQEGFLDPDWAVNTDTSVEEKFTAGKSIIACSNRAGVQVTTPAMREQLGLKDEDIGYISALEGSDGTCKYMSTEALNQVSCIPKTSENAADAVNWMNLKVQQQLFICIGEEGKHFTYDDKGQIAPINPIFADERGDSYWYIDCTDAGAYAQQWPSRIRKSDAQWLAWTAVTIKTDEERPEIFVDNPFKFMPASENYAKYETSLFTSLNDFITQVLSGVRSIDDLDNFMADWTNNGGEDVRTELQAYIDSQK